MSNTIAVGSKQVEDLPISGVTLKEGQEYVDPTYDEREEAGDEDESCQRTCHFDDNRGYCTRPPGHDGMHYAGNGEVLVGAW